MKDASWVIIERSTGKPVMETFKIETAEHIRKFMPNYEVKGIMAHLQSLNA